MTTPGRSPAGPDGPLVSVITPCHDAAAFVAETIESVLAQTYAPIEAVVVDDASTDGSWEVVERYADRIRALRLPRNRGGAGARNEGAAVAAGDLLMFLDADDLIAPDTIAALVAAARSEPGSLGVCPWRRLRRVAGAWVDAPGEVPFPPPPDALRGWLEESAWVPTCSTLWPRDVYERTGGWDERLTVNQDGELMMRALARGARLSVAVGGISYYRAHGPGPGSLSTKTFTRRWFESQLRVLASVASELERAGRIGEYAGLLGSRYAHLGHLAYVHGFPRPARVAFHWAVLHGGAGAVSRTWWGRVLERCVGADRKEQVAFALARMGIATSARSRLIEGHTRAPVAPGPESSPDGGAP